MTPEASVERLARILETRSDFSENDAYVAMAEAGIPPSVADRAYKFTQIAWCRVLLDGLGIRFAPDFRCLNRVGDVIEAGMLANEPYFAAAMRLAPQFARAPGFAKLAMMAAEFSAVNQALLAGSKAENLVTATHSIFLEEATPAGLDKARLQLKGNVSAAHSPKKPWWRFW